MSVWYRVQHNLGRGLVKGGIPYHPPSTPTRYRRWRSDASPDTLSAREHDVVSALGQGLTDREIAAHLGISERTVQNHLQHIYAKLGAAPTHAELGVVMAKKAE